MQQQRRRQIFVFFTILLIISITQITYSQELPLPNPSEGFSPNGDNINDYWFIKDIENYPENQVYIYNTWGKKITEIGNYDNKSKVFRGIVYDEIKSSDELLPFGTYFYVISLPSEKSVNGYFVIGR